MHVRNESVSSKVPNEAIAMEVSSTSEDPSSHNARPRYTELSIVEAPFSR